MRRACVVCLVLLLVVCSMTSCLSGPHQMQRTIDDWDAKLYTDTPWLNAALQVVPVIPLARLGAGIADFFATDAYFFWLKDAWDGKGTGFKHQEILGEEGHVESLLLEGSGWFKVKTKQS